jgi:hypothetical protein
MYLAITSGSGAAGRLGGGPEHAAETGLAGADRFDVGRRSRHDADCPGAGQDQGGGLRWRERYIERGIEGVARCEPAWPQEAVGGRDDCAVWQSPGPRVCEFSTRVGNGHK